MGSVLQSARRNGFRKEGSPINRGRHKVLECCRPVKVQSTMTFGMQSGIVDYETRNALTLSEEAPSSQSKESIADAAHIDVFKKDVRVPFSTCVLSHRQL